MYLYGIEFTVKSDHQLLERKLLANMKHQQEFKVKYIPGHENAADILPSDPVSVIDVHTHEQTEKYVNYIIDNAVPVAFYTRRNEKTNHPMMRHLKM